MNRLLIAPEPASWLAEWIDENTTVLAPWALPASQLATKLFPAHLAGALQRRFVRGAKRVHSDPGFLLADTVLKRAGSARALGWKLRQRVMVGAWAAALIRRGRFDQIVAPSLAALKPFAAAPRAERVLLEDLPGLRQLHADLDAAVAALPHCAFLQNFRAKDAHLIRQEREYVLATRIQVRSRFAKQRAIRSGAAQDRIEPWTLSQPPRKPPALRHDPSSRAVLVAGTTATRFGLEVALEALREHPELTLWCRAGEGSHWPSLQHPRLQLLQENAAPLPPLLAVVAPSWVEASAPELGAALTAGVPVIATSRVLGWIEPSPTVVELPPGDSRGLAAALGRITESHHTASGPVSLVG